MAGMVYIKNPDLPPADPAKVSREAFDQHFADRGFVIVEELDDNGDPIPEPTEPTEPAPEARPAPKFAVPAQTGERSPS